MALGPLPLLIVEDLQLVLRESQRDQPIRFGLMLNQDVDQDVLLQSPSVFRQHRISARSSAVDGPVSGTAVGTYTGDRFSAE